MHECALGLNDILHLAADNSKDDYRKVKAIIYDSLNRDDESIGSYRDLRRWQNKKADNIA